MSAPGAKKPIRIVLGFIAFLLVLVILGFIVIDSYLRGKMKERQETRAATRAVADTLDNAIKGKDLGERPKLPDNAVGRASKIAYDMMAQMTGAQEQFLKDLERIRWDEIMGAESFRPANVKRSLERVAQAKSFLNDYEGSVNRIHAEAYAKMTEAVGPDPDGKEFLGGFNDAATQKGKGLYFVRETLKYLRKNLEGIHDAYVVLQKHPNGYSVDKEGTIVFKDVPDSVVDEYNEATGRVNAALTKVNELEDERLAAAKKTLADMRANQ